MRQPVRVVCGACLQSLEGSSGDDGTYSGPCPFCGYQVGGAHSDSSAPTGDFESPAEFGSPDDDPTERVHPQPVANPDRIGRFLLREPLGEGGYGQVYRAYDPRLDRDVALKVLKAARLNDKAIERFYREARAAARLDHPNIVGLHDAGRDDGRCWIAYQLVSGRTLSQIRQTEAITGDQAIRIVRDLALALNHAHSRGVFHRDLKPANVMIDDTGRTRLTDFGLARRVDMLSDLTREGTVLGTPHYMSPEAAAGRSHAADARSDVYSLGVILYELICGRRPTDLPSDSPPWRYKPNPTPPTPRSLSRTIPPALDRICMRALAFNPDDRYPSGQLLADALESQLRPASRFKIGSSERTAVVPPPPTPDTTPAAPASRRITRGRMAMASAGVLAATILGMAAWWGPRLGSATPTPAVGPQSTHSTPQVAVVPNPAPADPPRVATPPPAPEPEVRKAAIIGNRTSHYYHRPGCGSLSNMADRNELPFDSAEEARKAGLRPCKRCKPGE